MTYEDIDYSRVLIGAKDQATENQDKEIEKYNQTTSKTVKDNLKPGPKNYLYRTQQGIIIKEGYEQEFEKIKEEQIDPLKFTKILDIQEIETARDEIIKKQLDIVCESLDCQAASIFLISKDRKLRHIGISGKDKEGKSIEFKYFCEEIHEIGIGFIGKSVTSEENSDFGTVGITDSLEKEFVDQKIKEKYFNKFLNLKSAMVAPLHGAHRSFGLLMVINKKDAPHREINLLSALATSIAYRLSLFRSNTRIKIQQYLSQKIIEDFIQGDERQIISTCQNILDSLIKNPETSYRAGVLRVYNPFSGFLEVQSTSEFNLQEERNNQNIKIGHGLAGFVAKTRRFLSLTEISREENLSNFRNHDWIRNNNLMSFCCFPMVAQDELIGTISLYTSCNHGFHPEGLQFLQSISNSLAALIYRSKSQKFLRLMNDLSLEEILPKRLNDLFNNLSDLLDGSREYIHIWLSAPHPSLGNKPPKYYLEQGKIEIIEDLIDAIETGQIG